MVNVKRILVKRNLMTGDDTSIEVEIPQYSSLDELINARGEFYVLSAVNHELMQRELVDARREMRFRVKTAIAAQNT